MAEEVRAELVANIARVVVAVGEVVEAGQMVVLLESMKMEIPVLAEHGGTVAEVTRAYQASVPELAEKFRQYDMFAPEFALSCLNRLQLRNNQQMVDLTDPAGALQLIGTLKNPIAGR